MEKTCSVAENPAEEVAIPAIATSAKQPYQKESLKDVSISAKHFRDEEQMLQIV